MGSQNEMIQTSDLIEGATTHNRGAEGMEGIGGREPLGFPGNLQEAHHLQEETDLMDRVNAVHSIQTK